MTEPLFEVRDVDRTFYAERIRDFLPERMIDVHTHVWRDADLAADTKPPPRSVTWPSRVAKDDPIEDLLETYRLMLPGKRVTPLIFTTVADNMDLNVLNAYTAECSRVANVPALLFTHPEWPAAELARRLSEGGFLGTKCYLSLVPDYIPSSEIRILDYFPPHQLEVLDRLGLILMLHIPRPERLRDPVNLAQMLHIERAYPNIKVIVAHVGRAYCDHDIGNAFDVLAASERMCFDFSANTNAWVFEQLLRCVGPKRVLFGSDMPVLRMRMRRITQGDHYVNLVPSGLYGDVSGDPNMGEVEGSEADALTFFLYEELDAFRRAAEAVGLDRADVEDVFYNNAAGLISAAGFNLPA